MGVHGLWELLSPVGRRVSVETLVGKRLAIDASIWMIQFMKAMRDEKGEMVKNAHVLGFFRRICKLLYLRTKPIFVFDGATPALKRRTVIARRRQRENAQTKVRKTAEKLLLNHLKAMKLKQLAEEMKTERKASDGKGKKILDDEINNMENNLVKSHVSAAGSDQEKLDEMLAASLAAEEGGRFLGNASTSAAGSISEEDEEMILPPTMQGNVDPAVLAALPPSMQLDLLVQMRERLMAENRQKYQKVKKELLQMFGLPYIIAPMEAEAQCAYMEVTGSVDGVVTDDSDVFLFGARSVYKNIFDDRKYVETYLMKDVENELGLSREKLIRMALLLGSDYTEGVSGIGIVNAIEVVNAFPDEDGLYKFREWIESPDPTILGNFEEPILSSKKRTSKASENDGSYYGTGKDSYVLGQNVSGGCEQMSTDQKEDVQKIFMEKHRKVSKNWHIPTSFPSEAVISAYLAPQVDRSTEPFSWGKPDILVLRKLCWEKFAWTNQKADELLLPVLKEYNKHETQMRLESFYTFNERFAKIRSKRIKNAVKGIAGKQLVHEMDGDVQEVAKSSIDIRENNSKDITGIDDHGDGLKELSKENLSHKNSKKRKAREIATSSARGLKGAVGKLSTNRVCSENVRGQGRGGFRKIRSGRGKTGLEFVAATSSKGASSDSEQEVDAEIETGVRRSCRTRRTVNYTEDDFVLNNDNTDKLPIASDQDRAYGVPQETEAEPSSSQIISEYGTDGFADKLPPEDLRQTYLERENQHDLIQNGNSPVKVHLSDEYLMMGGGFCVEEEGDKEINGSAPNPSNIFNEHGELSDMPALRGSDKEIDQVISPHSPKRTIIEPQSGGSIGGHDLGSHVNRINTIVDASGTRAETMKDDKGHNSAGVLSAMPFLRRKRRRGS